MSYSPLLPERGQSPRGTVYLLCFDRPLAHAQHYLGWTENLEERLAAHAAGTGSALLAAARAAGITWTVVRTWHNVTRRTERRLKHLGSAKRICPACAGPGTWGKFERRA